MTYREAAIRVLEDEGRPLNYRVITTLAKERDYLDTDAEYPEQSMNYELNREMREGIKDGDLTAHGEGVFGLREWGDEVEAHPWDCRMWLGLMEWAREREGIQADRILSEQARTNIMALLAEDALDELTIEDFDRVVFRHGGVFDADDNKIDTSETSPDELRERLSSGDWHVEGNVTVGQGAGSMAAYMTRASVPPNKQAGMLRDGLRDLLHGEGDAYERIDQAVSAVAGFSKNTPTLLLCMSEPDECGILNNSSERGLRKLAVLLGTEDEWAGQIAGDYRQFNRLLHEILDNSGGVLNDLLEVDSFLHHLDYLGEPKYWKVAIALDSSKGEHEELVKRAGEQGFAAVKGGDPDPNDVAFREIQPGDYVVMHIKGRIGGVGMVTRPYYEIDVATADEVDKKWYRRIGVDWLLGVRHYGPWLPGGKQRRTVIDLDAEAFWALAANYADDPRFEEALRRTPPARDLTVENVADECCAPVEFIEEILAQLEKKKQMVFYGPPGTGKTFVARELAKHLAEGDDQRWGLIQFHPSYTYEDFMEGIKPQSVPVGEDSYEVSYPVLAGSFMRFCQRAAADPDYIYTFIIDEINRGQIAKIFGELMYLLEYREDEIQLAYTKSASDDAPAQFAIPDNVRIIGTMNTADRSIALVDFALRRRFAFYPFYPDDDSHVQGMLARWLQQNSPEALWVADLLVNLNKMLRISIGREFLVGHSYFMDADGMAEEKLREVWRFQIEPLLHEYFVGKDDKLRAYDVDQLIAEVKGATPEVASGAEEEEPVGAEDQ